MEIQALQAQLRAKVGQAQALVSKYPQGDMPDTDLAALTSILGETDTLKAKIGLAQRTLDAQKFMDEPATLPAYSNARPATKIEGETLIDPKAWREFKVPIKAAGGTKEDVTFRYFVPEKVQKKGYSDAIDEYLRKGRDGIRPDGWKLLQETIDTAGGFLIPEDFTERLVQKLAVNVIIRQLATVLTSSRDVLTMPRINYSADNLHVIPGRPTATGEVPASSTAARVTDQTYGKVEINVNTVMMTQLISNDFLDDQQFDVLSWTADKFAEEYGLYEDNKFINGSGANEAFGLITAVGSNAASQIPQFNSGTASSPYFTFAGVVNMEGQLPPQYEKNARWLANKAAYAYIRQIADSQGRPLWPIYTQVSPLGALPTELLDYPILKSQFMPDSTVTSNVSTILGDFKGYYIVDRIGLSIQRLMEVYAEVNATSIVARKRFGGQVVEPWRMVAMITHT